MRLQQLQQKMLTRQQIAFNRLRWVIDKSIDKRIKPLRITINTSSNTPVGADALPFITKTTVTWTASKNWHVDLEVDFIASFKRRYNRVAL